MRSMIDGATLIASLPQVRGRLEPNVPMAGLTWFRTGGPAEVLFTPADEEDLSEFLSGLAGEVPVYPVGMTVRVSAGRLTGCTGVVAKVNRRLLDRPVVRITRDQTGQRVRLDVDLSLDKEIGIESIL